MPMLKRPIEPSAITRASEGKIPGSISNELEYVANSTQANLIRQLSSLSKHAEDMFSELFVEATTIFNRTCQLTNKVDNLRDSVQQFDPNQVVVKLTDITKRKPYKTEYQTDQQICTKGTMPASLEHMYKACAPPPRLDKFDRFRTDGKSSIKMYTNPDYFVQLWVESLEKNVNEKKKHENRKIKKELLPGQTSSQRPSKKDKKGREITAEVQDRSKRNEHLAKGKEFIPADQRRPNSKQQPRQQQQPQSPQKAHPQAQNGEPRQSRQQRISQSGDPGMPQQYNDQQGGYHQSAPAPPAPTQQMGGQTRQYQEMIYDDSTRYNINQSRPGSQLPPPPPQSMSNSSDLSRASVASHSPSMNRMTMPPPPPPPPMDASTHSLPPPPSPPAPGNVGIVPPPPPNMMHDPMDSIRPASPPPPLSDSFGYIPTGVPPPPQPMSPPSQQPQNTHSPAAPAPPPPPPPPPPPGPGLPAAPPAPPSLSSGPPQADMLSAAASRLRNTQDIPKQPPVQDERSDLLNQIRLGIQLRGAEERKQNDNGNTLDSKKVLLGGTFDVQSIMDKVQEMRRHVENSDSESDYEDEWDDSDDD